MPGTKEGPPAITSSVGVSSTPVDPTAQGAADAQTVAGRGGGTAPYLLPVPQTKPAQDTGNAAVYGAAATQADDPIQAMISRLMGAEVSPEDKWLSLASAGFTMAGSQRPFLGAVAEGATSGLAAYQAAQARAKGA